MLNDCVAVCAVGAVESVTFVVKLYDPAVVGVPGDRPARRSQCRDLLATPLN